MKVLVTGGSGVLGHYAISELTAAGHEVVAPSHAQLDLFDAKAVSAAVRAVEAVMHLATRIPQASRRSDLSAWSDNDRLRIDATGLLIAAARKLPWIQSVVVPTVALVYPAGPADESTPLNEVPAHLQSALAAEEEVARFADQPGRRGVVLRLGRLYGPGTGSRESGGNAAPAVSAAHAGWALATALQLPSGIYNVVDPDGDVDGTKFRNAVSALRVRP